MEMKFCIYHAFDISYTAIKKWSFEGFANYLHIHCHDEQFH